MIHGTPTQAELNAQLERSIDETGKALRLRERADTCYFCKKIGDLLGDHLAADHPGTSFYQLNRMQERLKDMVLQHTKSEESTR